jgi:hypothetical protein
MWGGHRAGDRKLTNRPTFGLCVLCIPSYCLWSMCTLHTAPPLPFGLQGWGVDYRLPITVSRGGSTSFERFPGAITSDYLCGIRLFHLHMRTSNRQRRSVGGLRLCIPSYCLWSMCTLHPLLLPLVYVYSASLPTAFGLCVHVYSASLPTAFGLCHMCTLHPFLLPLVYVYSASLPTAYKLCV